METFTVGSGAPDAFVWTPRTGWLAIEIKAEKGKLTPDQVKLHALCAVTIWRSYDDVLSSLAFSRRRK